MLSCHWVRRIQTSGECQRLIQPFVWENTNLRSFTAFITIFCITPEFSAIGQLDFLLSSPWGHVGLGSRSPVTAEYVPAPHRFREQPALADNVYADHSGAPEPRLARVFWSTGDRSRHAGG